VHIVVLGAVAFLVVILPALFLSVPWWVVLVAAVLVGLVAAPFSRRAEMRALAARERPAPPE
jgi:hypothetical protein